MNRVYFDKNQIEQGLHHKLIDLLIEQSYSEQDEVSYYNDIRIVPADLGAIDVEWENEDWGHEYSNGKWEWIDDEEKTVFKNVHLPNGETRYAIDEEEAKQILEDWVKENPIELV